MMNNNVIVKTEGLSKKFCLNLKRSILYGTLDVFRNMFGIPYDSGRLRRSEFWALNDVSFELRRGETLGIIGVNGSGKTTLLRLLSGIFPPDKGKITVKGRIGSLIAVGAGFHPHMTGRENIFLNGTILGQTKREILRKFDSIVDFAEIGDFLEAPVATYSSGMRVRLGFAIAVHSEPDILLLDEILSVGDLTFRNKCMKYMYDLRKKSKGIIFVSHNIEQIRMICTRVILMHKGKFIFDGDTEDALIKYYQLTDDIRYESMKKEDEKRIFKGEHISSGDMQVLEMGLMDENGNIISEVTEGADIVLYYDFVTKKKILNPYISAAIRDERDFNIIWHVNIDQKIFYKNLEPGKYRLKVIFNDPHIEPNVYRICFGIQDADTLEYLEKITFNKVFKVVGQRIPRGTILCKSKWELKKMGLVPVEWISD